MKGRLNESVGALARASAQTLSPRYIELVGELEALLAEAAAEKGADTVLMPVSARKQLFELSDDMATRISTQFYSDAPDALLKALLE